MVLVFLQDKLGKVLQDLRISISLFYNMFFFLAFNLVTFTGKKILRITVSFSKNESNRVYFFSLAVMLTNFGNLGMTSRL